MPPATIPLYLRIGSGQSAVQSALNNRGWDAWVELRRLDFPALVSPSGPGIPDPLSIPVRMIFPVSEQTQNDAQWSVFSDAKYTNGTADSPNSKLFWDVN